MHLINKIMGYNYCFDMSNVNIIAIEEIYFKFEVLHVQQEVAMHF